MADVPDIKLIRTDTTLDLDLWALVAGQRRLMPCPFLSSKKWVFTLQKNEFLHCCLVAKLRYGTQ